ncbi:hypothetical protein GCM10009820_36530 [Leifsonia soli]
MLSQHELNPAGRLYLYLSHVGGRAGNENMADCVASWVKVSVSDLPALYSTAQSIATLSVLASKSVTTNSQLPGAKAAAEELAKVDTALRWGAVLQGQVDAFRNQYDAGTLRVLEMWSETLNQSQGSSLASTQSGIEEVRIALADLAGVLRDDESIDERVRSALLKHVNLLTSSIDQFFVGGVDALLTELDRLLGLIVRDGSVRVEVGKKKRVREAVERVMVAVGLVANVISASHTAAIDIGGFLALESAPSSVVAPALQLDPTV